MVGTVYNNDSVDKGLVDMHFQIHWHVNIKLIKATFLSVKCNFDRLYNHFGFCPCVCCVCVCPPIGCQTITSAILYRFSPNFACRSEMWLFRTLLFLRQTGNRLPILEMCKIQFWQFRDCGDHIFPRFITKIRIELKLISIDFILVVNETRNRIRMLERCKFRFRYRFHPVYNDYICNSLPFFL